jgi:predicted RNase H-like HicB family nuclease
MLPSCPDPPVSTDANFAVFESIPWRNFRRRYLQFKGELSSMTNKKQDEKLIFKTILPEQLRVEVHEAEAGESGYWAKAREIPCYSQGETFTELFDVLTKAIYAYYNVPEKLIPELGTYSKI